MNWIIQKSNKLQFHTNLSEVIKPIKSDVKDYYWLVADLDYIADSAELPVNFQQDFFILSPAELEQLLSKHVQIIWGAILGFPKLIEINLSEDKLPYVEGNDAIWKAGCIQHKNAVIEIDCFDSSYTIVKFRNEQMSQKFKEHFTEAIPLEKFK